MLLGVITSSPEIAEKIKESYTLKFDIHNSEKGIEFFRRENFILLKSSDDKILEGLNSLKENFEPEAYINLDFANSLNNEHLVGDVVLPNTFFEYHNKVDEIELDKENRDNFIKNPLFLENYDIQNDYNFEKFGLSIGGICLSAKNGFKEENRKNINMAYESDIIDEYSYYLIKESLKLDIKNHLYIIKIIRALNKEDKKEILVENGVNILNFLINSMIV
ncbi:MAG: hypothetical protein PHF46_05165 [Candidatus Gracilibacteria bacterium]|nr:hypothetical protein [Candidatus Gracilibacteria bacterium]MDD4530116.1 hypothetical protein [Candidatus Gracilibacteria bacterium]